jgi:cell division protein FtsA
MPARIGIPLELGSGLSTEIESPEFATVGGLIKGVPGSPAEDTGKTFKLKKDKGGLNVGKVFKRIQEFFDEL